MNISMSSVTVVVIINLHVHKQDIDIHTQGGQWLDSMNNQAFLLNNLD